MVMADHERDARDLRRQALESGRAVAVEAVTQEQILGGVAAQRELRSDQQIGPGGARLFAVFEDLRGVAGEITDDAVDLRDRDLDDAAHRGKSTIGPGNAPRRAGNL